MMRRFFLIASTALAIGCGHSQALTYPGASADGGEAGVDATSDAALDGSVTDAPADVTPPPQCCIIQDYLGTDGSVTRACTTDPTNPPLGEAICSFSDDGGGSCTANSSVSPCDVCAGAVMVDSYTYCNSLSGNGSGEGPIVAIWTANGLKEATLLCVCSPGTTCKFVDAGLLECL
jgi:hypothetical protein